VSERPDLAIVASNKDDVGYSNEQTGSYDARNQPKLVIEPGRVENRSSTAIENEIAVVRNEVLTPIVLANERLEAELADFTDTESRSERNHLDGQFAALAEALHHFFRADENYSALAGRSHNLFADQRPTPSFDQVQLEIDFVGAIYVDRKAFGFIEGRELDSEPGCEICTILRGRNAADVEAAGGQGMDESRSSSARAQAYYRTRTDIAEGRFAQLLDRIRCVAHFRRPGLINERPLSTGHPERAMSKAIWSGCKE